MLANKFATNRDMPCIVGIMKRCLEEEEWEEPDLVLQDSDGEVYAVKNTRCLFRGGFLLPAEAEERPQVAVAQVAGLEGVLRVEVLGDEAVAVEDRDDQGEWRTVQVLEKGEDAILEPGSRIYVLGEMLKTVLEVLYKKSRWNTKHDEYMVDVS